MDKIFNHSKYKSRRQDLRNAMPEPEKKLWALLRKQKMGVKFRRQHGIGHYIVDFYCAELKLVIEVDGDSHFSEEAKMYDTIRDDFISSLGITTIRVKNDEVMKNIEGIFEKIQLLIHTRASNKQETQNA